MSSTHRAELLRHKHTNSILLGFNGLETRAPASFFTRSIEKTLLKKPSRSPLPPFAVCSWIKDQRAFSFLLISADDEHASRFITCFGQFGCRALSQRTLQKASGVA